MAFCALLAACREAAQTSPMAEPRFHYRSYADAWGGDHHAYAQWVLPIQGELQFELDGHAARLDLLQGAFVAPGEDHDQFGQGLNTHLIIDCDLSWFDDLSLERLRAQRWLALPRDLRQQLAMSASGGDGPAQLLPMVVQAFTADGSGARLQALAAQLQARPDALWTVERMAAHVGLRASQLHARFLREFGLPPQAWLAALRLRRARHLLRTTTMPISEIALACGYSEQSALNRAWRRNAGGSPAAWRRGRGP